ncbi:unnamed protein product [Pocillopora meandrina]|uniref:G-protein coupled receptors family 2 profile 2 domain-containing protein n=1 Tax=Pocillopora meandrina TaxID=46732 RepID=A0AAU9XUK4_9CNID|nr:unnamed protein product [Pocillopora meandrina]
MSHCNLRDHHCCCCNRWYIGLKKKGENWTWVNRKLLNMSKWAEERQSRGAVAHICKQSVNGDQGLFYNIHGSRNLAYICEIPKGKTKLLFIFKTELSKRHAKSSRVMRMLSMCSRSSSPLLPSQLASHSPCQLYSLSFWLSTSQTPFQLLSQSALQWTFQSTAVASSPSGSIKLRSTPSLPVWSLSSTLFSLSQSPSLSVSQSPFSQSPKSRSQLSSLQSPFDLPSSALLPSQSLLPSTSSSPLQSKMIQKLAAEYVSKLRRMDITNASSLQEAIVVLEVFITSIKNITRARDRALVTEEIEIKREFTFNVAVAFEEFALNYSKLHLIGTRSSQVIDNHIMVLGIQKTYYQNAGDFYLEDQELQASINVLSANFAKSVSLVVGIVYKDLHELLDLDQPIRNEDTRIMGVAMDPKPNKLEANVILKFRNLRVTTRSKLIKNVSVTFFFSPQGFSRDGCYVDPPESNSEDTVCRCNHLTHFSLLADFSYILENLSQIRLSLFVSLGAEQIISLAGINATEKTAVCVTVVALMHYFLMVAFCWMLVEEIHLYLFVVKVSNINTKMHMYHVISWGFPVIMIAISQSIAPEKYGIQIFTSYNRFCLLCFCWMSSTLTNNLIWIFVAFVIMIILTKSYPILNDPLNDI